MTPQPAKPTTPKSTAKPEAKAPDPPKAEETATEGAPDLVTPESPGAIPEETPRDDSAPLETPEAPIPDEETIAALRKDELKEEAAAHDLPVSGTKAELTERLLEQAEVDAEAAEEDRLERYEMHVSISPVDAHAPVWTPHTPNTTGGYS